MSMEQLKNAHAVIDILAGEVAAAWKYLNETCLENGRLSSAKLDTVQLPSYELAFCDAEVKAARHIVEYAEAAYEHGGGDIEPQLALTFVAEAVSNIRGRLVARPADYGYASNASRMAETLFGTMLIEFVAEHYSSAKLEALGELIISRDGRLGVSEIGEDAEMIRDTFRKFATEEVMPRAEHIHRNDDIVPDDILQPLIEMGCLGLSIPEKFGGLQPDDHEESMGMIVTTEELSRGSLAAAGSLITRPEIMSRALLKGGTEAQKAKWLPGIAEGNPLVGIAFTEPNFGSDVAGMQLKAVRTEGGWILNGAKAWCTFAGKAGVLLTLARTDPDMSLGHKGLTMFMVEKDRSDGHSFEYTQPGGGKLTGKAIPTIGYRGMHSFDVFYDNVFVPDENVVGEEEGLGRGFYLVMAGMTGGRIQTSARANGVMRAAFEKAVSYSTDRKVFGQPIGNYQLTRVKIARMASLLTATREFSYSVARQLDAGKGQMEASLVKLYACKAAQYVTSEALQIHGGMGYAEETDVSRYFVDARVLSIFEGAEETLALKVVARTLIDQAGKVDKAA